MVATAESPERCLHGGAAYGNAQLIGPGAMVWQSAEAYCKAFARRSTDLEGVHLNVHSAEAAFCVHTTQRAVACRKGSLQHQAVDLAAGTGPSPWAPLLGKPAPRVAGAAPTEQLPATVATTYRKLINLQHIPPTKMSFFQVRLEQRLGVLAAAAGCGAVQHESARLRRGEV